MEKTKQEITREMLKENIMKKVLITMEYSSTLDINKYIDEENKLFYEYFRSYNSGEEKEIKIEIGNQSKVLENNIVGGIHLFKGFVNNDQIEENVQLSVTKNNINFEIDPENNYKCIDPYIKSLIRILSSMKKVDPFLKINKVILKKNSFKIYESLENLFEDFEKKIISSSNEEYERKLIREIETIKYKSFLIFYNRGIETGIIQKEGKPQTAFRGYLDISGILENDNLEDIKEINDLEKVLQNLNLALFDIFKNSMTESFLNKNIGGIVEKN